jgi:hypothetical protein
MQLAAPSVGREGRDVPLKAREEVLEVSTGIGREDRADDLCQTSCDEQGADGHDDLRHDEVRQTTST